ncbi:retrovirus-related pol polyprotein from transposon opus [Trifolium medium]|uniref:Retrovirus-related pol polyprotein from transposon opus n=1 Tax=Trifolium medium TaxID=97028 RepID=A0A392LZJ0_9FABA|nr:retrovirus-related pol polyprotein from transposon opus [Trifolium medium]
MSSPPSISDIADSINALAHTQRSFQNNIAASIDSLTTDFVGLRARLGPPGFPSPTFDVAPVPATSIKLDIPRFDGVDPLGWIFKITLFFDYHRTSNDQRLRIASFYMEAGDPPGGARVPAGDADASNQSCEVTGREMLDRPSYAHKPPPPPIPASYSSSFKPTISVIPPKTQPPVKRLSPDELQARRDKGLCYNCDERYQCGHRCKRLFHLLNEESEEQNDDASAFVFQGEQSDPIEINSVEPESIPDPAQISLHALMGHTIP